MSQTVGLLQPWAALFSLPVWQIVIIFVVVLPPLGLRVVRLVFQWKVYPISYEWLSSLLDPGLAGSIMLLMALESTQNRHYFPQRPWVHVGIIASWLIFGLGKMYDERRINGISLKRHLGATSLYRLLVFPFVGYPLSVLLVDTIEQQWNSYLGVVLHLLAYAFVLLWLWAGIKYDAKHHTAPDGQSKFVYTAPEDGWRGVRLTWQWLRRSTGLSRHLRTFRLWNFIINRRPIQGFLVLAMVSPGMFLLLNWVMYGRWVPFSYQWYSALYGDLLLEALGAYCLWMLLRVARRSTPNTDSIGAVMFRYNHEKYLKQHGIMPETDVLPPFLRRYGHWLVVAFWYLFGLAHVWQESGSVSLVQHLGANSLYHTFVVYPLLGYTLTVLVWATLRSVEPFERAATVLVIAVCVGGWIALGVYDGAHQFAPNGVSKHVYASPQDGWHNVRLLWHWLVSHLGTSPAR